MSLLRLSQSIHWPEAALVIMLIKRVALKDSATRAMCSPEPLFWTLTAFYQFIHNSRVEKWFWYRGEKADYKSFNSVS